MMADEAMGRAVLVDWGIFTSTEQLASKRINAELAATPAEPDSN